MRNMRCRLDASCRRPAGMLAKHVCHVVGVRFGPRVRPPRKVPARRKSDRATPVDLYTRGRGVGGHYTSTSGRCSDDGRCSLARAELLVSRARREKRREKTKRAGPESRRPGGKSRKSLANSQGEHCRSLVRRAHLGSYQVPAHSGIMTPLCYGFIFTVTSFWSRLVFVFGRNSFLLMIVPRFFSWPYLVLLPSPHVSTSSVRADRRFYTDRTFYDRKLYRFSANRFQDRPICNIQIVNSSDHSCFSRSCPAAFNYATESERVPNIRFVFSFF